MEEIRKRAKPKMCKRTKEQIEFDRAFCADLFLRGYTYRDIADRLNADLENRKLNYRLTMPMVYYDIQQMLIEWKRNQLETIDQYVTAELQKLDKMEVEAWNAWELSKQKKTKNKTKKAGNGLMGRQIMTEKATETTSGNPRYLDLLLNIQQRRAKMLGFDAPIKIDIPGVNVSVTNENERFNADSIPDDLLFAVADKLQSAEYAKIIAEKTGETV